jgi:hypothetical protein
MEGMTFAELTNIWPDRHELPELRRDLLEDGGPVPDPRLPEIRAVRYQGVALPSSIHRQSDVGGTPTPGVPSRRLGWRPPNPRQPLTIRRWRSPLSAPSHVCVRPASGDSAHSGLLTRAAEVRP